MIVQILIFIGILLGVTLFLVLRPKEKSNPTEATEQQLKLLTTKSLGDSQIDVAFCSSETCCNEFNTETLSWGPQCDYKCNKEIAGGLKYGQFQKSKSIPVCGATKADINSASEGPKETFQNDKGPSPLLQEKDYGIWTKQLIEKLINEDTPKTLGSGGPHSNNFSQASGKYVNKFWDQGGNNDFSLVPKITSGTNIALGSGYKISNLNSAEPNTLGVQSKKKNVFMPYQIVRDNGISLTWDNSIIRTREAISSNDFKHGLQTEAQKLGIKGSAILNGINVSGTFNYNTNRSTDSTTNVAVRTDELFVSAGSLYISNDSSQSDARVPFCRTDGIDVQVFKDLIDYANPNLVDQYFTYKNNNGVGAEDINNDQTLEGYRNFMFQWGDYVLMEVAYGAKFIMRNFSSNAKVITKDDMTMKFCMEAQPIGAGGVNPNTPVPPAAPNGDGETLPSSPTVLETQNYNLKIRMANKHRLWERIESEDPNNSPFSNQLLFDSLQAESVSSPLLVTDILGDLVSVRKLTEEWNPFYRGKVTSKSATEVTISLINSQTGVLTGTTIVLHEKDCNTTNLIFNMPYKASTVRTAPDGQFFTDYDLPTPSGALTADKDPLFDFGSCAGWTEKQFDEMRSKKIDTKLKFLIGDSNNPIISNLLAKESLVGVTADELLQFYAAGLTEAATPIGFTFVPIWDILKEAINNVYSRNPDYRENVLRPNANALDEFIIRTPKKLTPTPRGRTFWDQTINNLQTAYIQKTICPLQKENGTVTTWMDSDPTTINPNNGMSTYQCKTLDYEGCMTNTDCHLYATMDFPSFSACFRDGRKVTKNTGGSNRYACDLITHNTSQQMSSIASPEKDKGGGCSWNYFEKATCACQTEAKNTKVIWDSTDRYFCNVPTEENIQP